ncbi:MAG: TetR/AcrR family transcriptional regulator [Clostridia bacterium]|nr:TetR/AcrR family transcriptional regulator [Clostridia bacterium]
MYKLCKTEQSSRRQRELELALLDMMKKEPYQDITVSSLCEIKGVPRKAFYRYFDHKDDALDALIDHTLMETEFFGSPVKGRTLLGEFDKIYVFWKRNASLLDVLAKNGMSSKLVERCVLYSISSAIPLDKYLSSEPKQMQEHIVKFAISGLMYSVINWHKSGFRETPREMANIAVRLFNLPLFPGAETKM